VGKGIRLAVLGGWAAHAADFARRALGYPNTEIAAVWDESESFARQFAREFGCRQEQEYTAILDSTDVDGVIVTSRTSLHAAITTAACRAGKHVYLEKAPALVNADAYAIRDAVRSSGIHFTISDPMEKPHFLYAKNLLDRGMLGAPTLLRYRTAHDGALQGENWYLWPRFYDRGEGGAMADIGCHAVHLLTMILGKPVRCSSVLTSFTGAGKRSATDENSVAVYEFENGAIGIAETGWVTENPANPNGRGLPFEFNLYGTKGMVRIMDGQFRYTRGGVWIEVSPDEYPPEPQHPMYYWLDSIVNDSENVLHGADEAVRFTEMISAAYRAADRQENV